MVLCKCGSENLMYLYKNDGCNLVCVDCGSEVVSENISRLLWLDEKISSQEEKCKERAAFPNSYGQGYSDGYLKALNDIKLVLEQPLQRGDSE